MTATYFAPELSTSALFRLRFRIGDTDVDAPLLQDEEIEWAIDETSGEDAALVYLARTLLTRYGAQPKSVRLPDGTSADFSDRVTIWSDLIARLDTGAGLRIRRLARPQAVGGSEYT
jgi:hypothetical protein